jgi:hypothetical protein
MNYEAIKKSAIYVFIVVTVTMVVLGVLAIWEIVDGEIFSKAFSTMLIVAIGGSIVAYAASLLEKRQTPPEQLPSFAPPQAPGMTYQPSQTPVTPVPPAQSYSPQSGHSINDDIR